MTKYRVFASVMVTIEVGVFEVDSAEEARKVGIINKTRCIQDICKKFDNICEINDSDDVFVEEIEE